MGRFEQDFSFDQVQYVRGRLSGLWELRVEESFKDSISPLVVNGYANSKGLQKRVFEGFFDGRAFGRHCGIRTSQCSNAPRLAEEDVVVLN